jgi:hypothetical protein
MSDNDNKKASTRRTRGTSCYYYLEHVKPEAVAEGFDACLSCQFSLAGKTRRSCKRDEAEIVQLIEKAIKQKAWGLAPSAPAPTVSEAPAHTTTTLLSKLDALVTKVDYLCTEVELLKNKSSTLGLSLPLPLSIPKTYTSFSSNPSSTPPSSPQASPLLPEVPRRLRIVPKLSPIRKPTDSESEDSEPVRRRKKRANPATETDPSKDAIRKRFKELRDQYTDAQVKGISWFGGPAGKNAHIRYKTDSGLRYLSLKSVDDVEAALKTAIEKKEENQA